MVLTFSAQVILVCALTQTNPRGSTPPPTQLPAFRIIQFAMRHTAALRVALFMSTTLVGENTNCAARSRQGDPAAADKINLIVPNQHIAKTIHLR